MDDLAVDLGTLSWEPGPEMESRVCWQGQTSEQHPRKGQFA